MCGVSSEHKAMELRHRAPRERLDQPVPFSERLTDREVCCNQTKHTHTHVSKNAAVIDCSELIVYDFGQKPTPGQAKL